MADAYNAFLLAQKTALNTEKKCYDLNTLTFSPLNE